LASAVTAGFVGCLSRFDFEGMRSLLADDVWFRILLPKRMLEATCATEVVDAFMGWFAEAEEIRFLDGERHSMAGREHLCYRYLLRPDWHAEAWYTVEQAGYCRVREGRISRLDLVCTGFHPASQMG
jgi:hypothetical protein